MHDHSGCLVDDSQVVIFENDIQGNILRDQTAGHDLRNCDDDLVPGFQTVASLGHFLTIYLYPTLFD